MMTFLGVLTVGLHLRTEEGRAGMGVIAPTGSAPGSAARPRRTAAVDGEGYDPKLHDPYLRRPVRPAG